MSIYRVTITFEEPILGTVPDSAGIYTEYIQSKAIANGKYAPDIADELDTLHVAKGRTGFHRDGSTPVIYDYAVMGFLKEACGSLRTAQVKGPSAGLKNYKSAIGAAVLIKPRRIPLRLSGPTFDLERPLRAETPLGPRVALAASVAAPAGSSMTFTVDVLGDKITLPMLEEWFAYGARKGMGQWRSGGWGRFDYAIELAKA